MATKAELIKKLSHLESMNDHLMAELVYIDDLMRKVGFAGGLVTIKETAKEIYENDEFDVEDDEREAI